MVLNRAGPVARERALVGGIPLYEGVSGAFATAQMAAVLERMDTDHLRRLDLELMAQCPRTLDPQVVARHLGSMRDLLDVLGDMTAWSIDDLAGDVVRRLAVERVLTQLVDLATAINADILSVLQGRAPQTARKGFSAMAEAGLIDVELARSLAASAGMRNLLTHEYVEVDPARVHLAIPAAARDYTQYVKDVAMWLSTATTD